MTDSRLDRGIQQMLKMLSGSAEFGYKVAPQILSLDDSASELARLAGVYSQFRDKVDNFVVSESSRVDTEFLTFLGLEMTSYTNVLYTFRGITAEAGEGRPLPLNALATSLGYLDVHKRVLPEVSINVFGHDIR